MKEQKMTSVSVDNANLRRLADKLKDDIRRRGLRPGDRYLTATEVGRQFKVTAISAHRAMQLLAESEYLVRQRGSGSFVGNKFEIPGDDHPVLSVAHVVMSMDYHRTATLPAELFVEQLYAAMPGTVVEVHYVPEYDSLRHLERIVAGMSHEGRADEGIILIRGSRPMQMYVQESGLPAVVFGGVYPGVTHLPWLDVDQSAVGRLMARYLLNQGHERFGLLIRNDWRHGENLMHRGIVNELAKKNIAIDAVRVCCASPDRDHIAAEVEHLLEQDRDITAIMCRTHQYAAVAEDVLRKLNKKEKRKVQLIAGGGLKTVAKPKYPYVCAVADQTDQVAIAGRMLADCADERVDTVSHQIIPVQLHEGV